MSKIPATATIIVNNEANNIAHCIKSVDYFSEVLVVDSGSTDDTVKLAEKAGAKVIHNPWPGYGQQKQFALENASYDWVFSLDADERVSAQLKMSLVELFSQPAQQPLHAGFLINRCNHFMGRALRHGEGYPDWLLRLFNRQHARWSSDPVHEKIELLGSQGQLIGDLDHYTEDSIELYLAKQNTYTSLQAKNMYAAGKPSSAWKLIASPVVRFLKFYVMRLGFLDGVPGLVHILIGCFNSFSKYAKLREMNERHPRC